MPTQAFRLTAAILYSALQILAQPEALGGWIRLDGRAAIPRQCAAAKTGAACVTLQDGRTLSVGSMRDGLPDNAAEIYDPAKAVWQSAPAMIEARAAPTATLLQDGRVLVAGGGTRSLEVFDPKTAQWTLAPGRLTVSRSQHAAALLQDGRVLIVGGWDGSAALRSTDVYDPDNGTVTPSGPLRTARFQHTATTLLDGRVLVAGGVGLASAEVYDPKWELFGPAGSMAEARAGHVAILLPDNNNVLLAGGQGADGTKLPTAEIYVPWTGVFRPAASLSTAREEGTGGAAPGGAIAVASEGGATFHFPTVRAVWKADGGAVEFEGEGWQMGETVQLDLERAHIAITADESGTFHQEVAQEPRTNPEYVTARGTQWETLIHILHPSFIQFTFADLCSSDVALACEYPQEFFYTVAVSGQGQFGTPTGTVQLLTGGSDVLESQTLEDGSATFIVSPPPSAGTYSITATYLGDSGFASSTTSPAISLPIVKNLDSVTIAPIGTGSMVYGQPIELTAAMSPGVDEYNNAEAAPTGTIQFQFAGLSPGSLIVLASPALQGSVYLADGTAGTASANVLALLYPLNGYTVTASYSGDVNYGKAVSTGVALTVKAASCSIGRTYSLLSPVYGQTFTGQYTVAANSPSMATPQGNSSVLLNGSAISNPVLDSQGQVSQTFAGLQAGANVVELDYAGSDYFGACSRQDTVTVAPDTPTVTVTSSANPALVGQTVTLTFTAKSTYAATPPPGYVSWSYGDVVGYAVLTNGSASTTFTPTTGGAYTVSANYQPAGLTTNYANSTGTMTLMVNPSSSTCDIDGDGVFTIRDVQRIVNEVLGSAHAIDDLNQDHVVSVTDVQIIVNAVLMESCLV